MLIFFFQLTLSTNFCKYITDNQSLLVLGLKILSYQKGRNTVLSLGKVQYGLLYPRAYQTFEVPGGCGFHF